MEIQVYCSILVFFLVFVFGVTPPEGTTPYQRVELTLRKLADNKAALNTFNAAFHQVLNKSYPRRAFGLPFRELITFETEYNENKVSPEIVNELKKILMYFYASTPVTTDSNNILANYHVTHFATWLNLNFETCISFYGEDEKNKKITQSCREISQFLKMFTSVLSTARTYQYAQFRLESPKHIKAVERNFLNEKQAKKISKRLKDAIEIDKVFDPKIDDCIKDITNKDEREYCNIWMEKITRKSIDFKLDHIFFDVYNDHLKDRFDVYSYDSYACDYAKSIDLWEKLPNLLDDAKNQQENMEKDKIITSYTAYALMQIINAKIFQFGVNPFKINSSRPILDENEYNDERYFQADDAETNDAQ